MRIQQEIKERQYTSDQIVQIAQNAEKICNRLTDDAFGNIEEVRLKLHDIEDKFGQFGRYIEDKVRSELDTFKLS